MNQEILTPQLSHTLSTTNFVQLGKLYRGKVRDVYFHDDLIFIITTDRVSAFDNVLTTLPFKGEMLTSMATHWFKESEKIAKNHIIDLPDPNVIVAKRCESLRVEIIVRGYLTGSLYRDFYSKGYRSMYGLNFPDDMRVNQKFTTPMITPTTKEDAGHDQPITRDEIISSGLVEKSIYEKVEKIALKLYTWGHDEALKRNLILVDTKYEFGIDKDGELLVIDEIHTQDSSRYWWKNTYDKCFEKGEMPIALDKEFLRQWILKEYPHAAVDTKVDIVIPDDMRVQIMKQYMASYQSITGQFFNPTIGNTLERIEYNLRKSGYLR